MTNSFEGKGSVPIVPLLRALDRRLGNSRLFRAMYNRVGRPIAVRLAISMRISFFDDCQRRIKDVLRAPDNRHIPRVPNAGAITHGRQVMHNGLSILPGSYYGVPMQIMLKKNRGVHEPQQERVFGEVLKHLHPKGVMIELGSYWAFYSMWFQKEIEQASCYLVEPDPRYLESGKKNFELNGMKGTFIQCYVGGSSAIAESGDRFVCVDDLIREYRIDHVDILHSDIQGGECDMLRGASQSIEANKIDYLFLSTHSNRLHYECKAFLEDRSFVILASADTEQSYSADGLIVAKSGHVGGVNPIPIALKPKE